MFARIFTLAAAVTIASHVVSAVPTFGGASCNVGDVKCCDSLQDPHSQAIQTLAGLAGVALGNLNIPVGVNCVPISVLAAGGNKCNAQPACCTGNEIGSGLTLACNPVNI